MAQNPWPASDWFGVNFFECFPTPIWICYGNPIFSKSSGDGGALSPLQIFEIQIANNPRRMNDRHCDSSLLGCRINLGHIFPACAKEFHSANRREADSQTVHPIANVSGC